MECSNLIISSTVLMRFAISELRAASRLRFFRRGRACPAVHLFLREANLRQDAANELRKKIVDLGNRMTENAAWELLQIAGSNAKLFRKEPLARFRDHQMNAGDARVLFE